VLTPSNIPVTYGRIFSLVEVTSPDAVELSGTVVDQNGCGATEDENMRIASPVKLDDTTWSYDEPTAELCECKHVGSMGQFIAMKTGSSNMTFTLKYDSDDEFCSVVPDSLEIPVPVIIPLLDLQVHDLIAKGFPKNELKADGTPEEPPHELDPGVLILCNLDDDNENGTPDFRDATSVSGENDLAECKLKVDAFGAPGKCYLVVDPGKIRVWETANKSKEIIMFEWDINAMPGSVFFEAIEGSDAPMDTEIKLMFYNDQGAYEEDIVLATLVSLDIAVDANRDGAIEFAHIPGAEGAKDETVKTKPFRFWVNDDNDGSRATEGEVIGSSFQDHRDGYIMNKRDLEDFTRLHIYIGGLQDSIAAGQIKVGMKWKNAADSPAVKVYLSADPKGSDSFLKNETAAGAQGLDSSGVYSESYGHIKSATATVLDQELWQGFSSASSNKCLLFEGSGEGKGQLVLTLHKADGTEIGEGPGVWLDILIIKKMYQRGKVSPTDIAAPQKQLSERSVFTGPVSVENYDNGQPFSADPIEEKKAIIFVHGWSMDSQYSINFSETMFKRLWHQGFNGRFSMFRWDPIVVKTVANIEASNGEYNRSEHRAWVYGAALKSFAGSLKNEGFDVSLVGHSMGNIVCGSAMREGLSVENYLLMEAAVPAGCFDESGGRNIGGINGFKAFWDQEALEPTPDYYQAPGGKMTKGYRGFLKNIGNNAERLVNFHNSDDFALATGQKYGLDTNWQKNQIDYKPDGNGGTIWRYFYIPTIVKEANRARLRVSSFNGRTVTHPWERMSFVARPRSKAMGAVNDSTENPAPNVAIIENINLRTLYNFGRDPSDHSGQFNRNIQSLDELYNVIKEICQPPNSP